jgi:hypothetical protein
VTSLIMSGPLNGDSGLLAVEAELESDARIPCLVLRGGIESSSSSSSSEFEGRPGLSSGMESLSSESGAESESLLFDRRARSDGMEESSSCWNIAIFVVREPWEDEPAVASKRKSFLPMLLLSG